MTVGLHDAERDHMPRKSFPNLALMKIAAYHRARGDSVEWWSALFNPKYDAVYSSKVFDFTPENPYLPDTAIKGGTGYGLFGKLPTDVDGYFPDYSMYPECDYAIGYITRGCPNRCRWCIVPAKEGPIRPYSEWRRIVRPDTKKIVLMDNNILASDYGIRQLAELSRTDYRLDLNQGMDARLVTAPVADILARLKWIRHIRFSCDRDEQLTTVERTVAKLSARGVRPYRVYVYLLVTSDLESADYRVRRLKRLGVSIYAQAERNNARGLVPDAAQLEFTQRYVYSGRYKKETWPEYCRRLHKEYPQQGADTNITGERSGSPHVRLQSDCDM